MGNKRKPVKGQAVPKKKKQKFSKGKGQPHQQQDIPLPAAADSDGEQDGLDIGEEDLEFVQQYGSQIGFLRNLDTKQLDKAVKDKQKAAVAAAAAAAAARAAAKEAEGDSNDESAQSDEEDAAEYERRPRAAEQVAKASTQGLPIKTASGDVVFQPSKKQQLQLASRLQVEGVLVQDSLAAEQQQQKSGKAAAKEAAAAAKQAAAAEKKQRQKQQQQEEEASAAAAAKAAGGDVPPALLSLMAIQDQQRRRGALKQQMALAAQHLLAEPEKHVGPGLRLLSSCAADRDGQVARLALLSLLAVFKDLLPGYRIRSLTEEEQQMRVSKEVQAVRDFESALLKGYQAFLKTLLAAATAGSAATGKSKAGGSSSALATARVATRCMGQLLVARPGFNYSSDLLQALVPLMAAADGEMSETACDAIRTLLLEDVQNQTSLEAVQLVADLVKRRKCLLPPAVVSSLLVLRFEQVTPTSQGGAGVGGKQGKARKVSKKKRKKSELDRDFEEAEAGPDQRELALLQSQMLEALFEIFFRVLKHCSTATAPREQQQQPGAGAAAAAAAAPAAAGDKGLLVAPWPAARVHRRFPLLQPTLEGLGRYSHLISVEYFNDLMAVLQELLGTGALPVRERLRVLLAVLDILRGQGEALTIDRRAFYSHLYASLLLVPLGALYEGQGGAGGGGPAAAGNKAAAAAAAAVDPDGGGEADWAEDEEAMRAVRISLLGWEAAGSPGGGGASGGGPVVPTSVLLLRCLEQQLLGVKQADMGRLAAFAKRLAETALQSSPSEALGLGCLLWRLLKRHSKLLCQLEWEGGAPVGGRQFDADAGDPSEAGALAAGLWELPLLARHYHPEVAAAARALLALTPGAAAAAAGGGGGGSASVITGTSGPQDLAAEYEVVRRGGFRPAPQVPQAAGRGRGKGGVAGGPAGSSKAGMAARQAAAARPWCAELQAAVAAAAGVQQEQQQQEPAAAAGSSQQGQAGQQRRKKQKQQEGWQGQQGGRAQQEQQQQQALLQAADDVDMAAVQAALQQQFVLSRQFQQNQQLRREVAIAERQLLLFREHLIQQQEKQQQEEQQRQDKQKRKAQVQDKQEQKPQKQKQKHRQRR